MTFLGLTASQVLRELSGLGEKEEARAEEETPGHTNPETREGSEGIVEANHLSTAERVST